MSKTTSSRRASRGRKKGSARTDPRAQGKRKSAAMVFTGRNYALMVLGVALVTVGYVIMRMENEVDGFISLYVAPLLILGGYLEIIYAILWRPRNDVSSEPDAAEPAPTQS